MKASRFIIPAVLATAVLAHAQQPAASAANHGAHHADSAAAGVELLSEGEVRKVDVEQGKVTLRHGPLTNLDMPAMTMVFTATDRKMLEGLKQGDKVRFTADRKDGAFVVTELQVIR
jgi:Cu(I)/Ag(I) efflux system protein CusF